MCVHRGFGSVECLARLYVLGVGESVELLDQFIYS
jgi:hypothetical protein